MPKYIYKAKTEEGEKISGQMQAMDENDLHLKLRQENKYLISAKRAEEVQRIIRLKRNIFLNSAGRLEPCRLPAYRWFVR